MDEIKIEKTADGLYAARVGSSVYVMAPFNGSFRILSCYGKDDVSKLKLPDFYSYGDDVSGLDGFKAFLSDLAEHLKQAAALGRYEAPSKIRTPWGQSEGATVYVENGIYFHSTPGHGGFKVFAKLNREIPEPYRNADGWYEEDCEYAKVVASLPAYFTDREVRLAKKALVNYFPDEYEAVTGEVIPEGQSISKDERLFKERHASDWVVIAASGKDDGTVHCWATLGGRRQGWDSPEEVEEAEFIVPGDEYSKRPRFGFVIDPDRHERVGAPATPVL